MRETHIPAEQPEAEEEARIPAPDAYAGRPRGDSQSPRQGPREPLGLIWRVRDRSSFRVLARGRRRRSGDLEVRTAVLGGPSDPPRVAFAVVLENQTGYGGTTAAPIAKQILQALLPSAAKP